MLYDCIYRDSNHGTDLNQFELREDESMTRGQLQDYASRSRHASGRVQGLPTDAICDSFANASES